MKLIIIILILLIFAIFANIKRTSKSSIKKQKRRGLLSGAENKYEPEIWNDKDYTQYHNCYDYAFNNINKDQKTKTQPGNNGGNSQIFKCTNIQNDMESDHPNIYIANYRDRCIPNYYKIALMMDNGKDYHFLRQDDTGYWSQKIGANDITNKDGNGNYIIDPENANIKSTNYNYNVLCNYYCVPNDYY